MKEIFRTLMQQLEGIQGVNYVGVNRSQLNRANQDTVLEVELPCILIGLSFDHCEPINTIEQIVDVNILLEVAFHDLFTDESFDTYSLLDEIHNRFQGFSTLELSPLSRVSLTSQKRSDSLTVFNVTYETTFTES